MKDIIEDKIRKLTDMIKKEKIEDLDVPKEYRMTWYKMTLEDYLENFKFVNDVILTTFEFDDLRNLFLDRIENADMDDLKHKIAGIEAAVYSILIYLAKNYPAENQKT